MYFDFIQDTITGKQKRCAHLLNLCMPGMGLFYWGYHKRAIIWLLGFYLIQIFCIVLGMILPLTPQLLMCCCICIWIYTQVNLVLFICKYSSQDILWSRHFSKWPIYLLSSFVLYAILFSIYLLVYHHFYMYVVVKDESMLPQVLPGDTVAVDRKIFQWQNPQVGDVIAIRCPTQGIVIRRILDLGPPSASFKLQGFMLWKNNQVLHHENISVNIEALPPPVHHLLRRFNFYYEYTEHKKKVYLIAHPKYPPHLSMKKFHISRASRMIFVLPDTRMQALHDLPCSGLIHSTQIIGKARYISNHDHAWSQEYSRIGLKIN